MRFINYNKFDNLLMKERRFSAISIKHAHPNVRKMIIAREREKEMKMVIVLRTFINELNEDSI